MTHLAEGFVRGCAFAGTDAVAYPRALPEDAGRLPADTWADATIPVGVRLELVGDPRALEVAYEAQVGGDRPPGPEGRSTFECWRGDAGGDDGPIATAPAGPGSGRVRMELGPPAPRRRFIVYLPEALRPRVLEVKGVDGDVEPAPLQPRWLCYGDSIAGGWVASAPARAWPAVAGRRYDLDVVNLGYAGAARGEIVTAQEIAALGADVISVAHGTNCWTRIPHSLAQMAANLEAFLSVVRQGHPTTPVVVASPVLRPDAEATKNVLGATLGGLRSVIEEVTRARMRHDPHLWLVEGADLLDPAHLVDGVHPGDEGHRLLAEAFGQAVRRALDNGARG